MASLDDVISQRNSAYDEIWSIAQEAISDLKAASRNSTTPTLATIGDLNFAPQERKEIIVTDDPIALSAIVSKIDGYAARLANVQLPDIPLANFRMEDHIIWQDSLADKIKAGLSTYMDTMGIPDVTYQNAIFNEDYERNLQIVNDLFELADAKTGARGFTYTNDYANSLKLDAQVKYQYDRTQVSRNVSKLVTEWARENYAMAIKEGIAFETFEADFTYKYCTAFVQIYKDMVLALLERFKAQIAALTEPIDALTKELSAVVNYAQLKLEADKTNETLKLSHSEVQLKEALGRYETMAKVIINEFSNQMTMIRASAEHSANIAQASTSSVIGLVKK